MKKIFAVWATCALLYVSAILPVEAGGLTGVSVTFPAFEDSKHVGGPRVNADALRGKVVFFEYWGIQCPPCVASMPHLQELYEKYGKTGRFIAVGSHVQMPGPKVKEFLSEKGITFPIYQFIGLNDAPCPGGIPYAVLIGADGKIVDAGSPFNIFKLVEEEMRKSAGGFPLFPDFEAKKYKSVAKSLVYEGVNLEGKIKPLRAKKDDPEAAELCSLFADWRKKEMSIVRDLLKNDPFAGIDAYEKLKVSLPESTKVFANRVAKLKKDKDLVAIAELDKKVTALEERKAKGRRISKQSVAPLRESVEPYTEDKRTYVKSYALAINTRLLALEKN